MPRSAALKLEQVPAASKPTLDMFTKNIGFTPNMLATSAAKDDVFSQYYPVLRAAAPRSQ